MSRINSQFEKFLQILAFSEFETSMHYSKDINRKIFPSLKTYLNDLHCKKEACPKQNFQLFYIIFPRLSSRIKDPAF